MKYRVACTSLAFTGSDVFGSQYGHKSRKKGKEAIAGAEKFKEWWVVLIT